MTGGLEANRRSDALDAYIARRVEQGFRVETRSGVQAVIVRRHPLYFALHWFARGLAEQRYVVSVDQHGKGLARRRAGPLVTCAGRTARNT